MRMGGGAKPYSDGWKLCQQCWKRINFVPLFVVAMLCSASYLLGIWQHIGGATVLTAISCDGKATDASLVVGGAPTLDFAAHHAANESDAAIPAAWEFTACDAKYSEYTPCEDRDRSLRFDRDRLIYRERHCPEKGELLKCLVPAPAGYRNPFPWPASRDAAWFANVPHKELTVEKAVQNWIRVDGDKFLFPGGGTMFPDGADAYIDDIDRLIPLRDGSIRTAIDTGCGVSVPNCSPSSHVLIVSSCFNSLESKSTLVVDVLVRRVNSVTRTCRTNSPTFFSVALETLSRLCLLTSFIRPWRVQVASWGAYLLSRNILTLSFAPRDSHEAQVQFALERGVPAMIGVLASNRLPYPSRAFDMAHCSRCLIPWHLYGNQIHSSHL
ncbi:hypothetical protein GW17_00026992 [Ensete ventricosum]|uniref:Methyltransferase n=1 Tax=Ensete ventricosum TaxID=4639 RepID=A0A427A056_ENSVE|nr:hypothetical protein B296_00037194 [Ensete ventricosum]RWW09518.1 hypothetical protein GW17_00026992 [Ensete ventricosum]